VATEEIRKEGRKQRFECHDKNYKNKDQFCQF
jgi:hypothetical protein